MRRCIARAFALVLAAWLLPAPVLAQLAEDPIPAGPEALPEIVPEDEPAEVPLPDTDPPPVEEIEPDGAPEMAPPAEVPTEPPVEAPAAPAAAPTDGDPFPLPEGLRGAVDFWTNVFGVWTNRQVAFHDISFPALVYEVIDLPGPVGGNYTAEQQRIVREHREAIEARLSHLEAMVAVSAPLSDDEKDLALLVTTAAGTNAIPGSSARVRSQRGIRERFRRGLEISGRYDAVFRKIFVDAGLPADIACLPHVESSFQAAARSSAGAVGVWQFTRGAAKIFMKLDSSIDERLDPVAAARGAARYLGAAHAQLGDWALGITSYNHGVAGMARARDQFGADFDRIVREYDGKLFGFASRNFYAEFLAARRIARDPQQWFPEGIAYEPPLATDEVVLPAAMSAQKVAMRYGVNVATLTALNPGWSKRAVRGGRALPAGISVWLPGGTLDRIAAGKAAKPSSTSVAKAAPRPAQPAQAAQIAHAAQAALPAPSATAKIAEFVVHVVRKGETLFDIATRHKVRLSDLLAANELDRGALIHPGQQLRVPTLR